MIGHYLLTLTPEQEDRVLKHKMEAGSAPGHTPCLVMTVLDQTDTWGSCAFVGNRGNGFPTWRDSVALRYDSLCSRFTTPRVNNAIRNRILSNQARRELRRQGEMFQPAEMAMVCDG